eukprot:scaffold5756_cov99-Cylindrotheca_fusiformis.AAC.5
MPHYHQYGSPNYSIMNLVIGWCVYCCLRNIWSIPSSFQNHQQEEEQQLNLSLMIHPNDVRKLPYQIINGRKAYLLPAIWADDASTSDKNSVNTTELGTLQPQTTQTGGLKSNQQRDRIVKENMTKQNRRVLDRYKRGRIASSATRSSQTETNNVARTLTSKTFDNNNNPSQNVTTTSKRGFLGTVVLLVFSGAVLAGGVFAKQALRRFERWETQSQEGSLVYDIAHTTSATNHKSYGSMGSSWSVEMNKYDL